MREQQRAEKEKIQVVEELRRKDTKERGDYGKRRTVEATEGKRLQEAVSSSCWKSSRELPSHPEWLKAEGLGTENSEMEY